MRKNFYLCPLPILRGKIKLNVKNAGRDDTTKDLDKKQEIAYPGQMNLIDHPIMNVLPHLRLPHPEKREGTLLEKAAAANARDAREWAGSRGHKYTAGGARQIERLGYSHDAMIDVLIANPGVTQNRLGEFFGYTGSWVSTIMASDAFQVRLAARRAELVDPIISASIDERLKALTTRSIQIVQDALEKPDVSVDVALKAAAFGAKALGIGGNAAPKLLIEGQGDRLAALAQKLDRVLMEKRGEVIDVESTEIHTGE